MPAIGDRVGIRYFTSGAWLPFTVERITERSLHCHSPIFGRGSSFCFMLDDPWEWQAWAECPALREKCGKCKGIGEIKSKKKGETFRECPVCRGAGVVARDDPFEASH